MVGDVLQPTHLLFILVVALLVLGPKRLPEVGRTLGSGLRDFRQAINGEATHHEEPTPRAYVEPEPAPVPPHSGDVDETESTVVGVAADEPDVVPATPDVAAANGSIIGEAPVLESTDADTATISLLDEAPAPDSADPDTATMLLEQDLEPPAVSDDAAENAHGDEPSTTPEPVAAASSTGFASALAASRQRPADDDEPAAGDV
jgi:sec-independent protein translocase protein TatA